MPAHAKTNEVGIVYAARVLLERRGRDGFSMNDVATAVGVRAPSLYGRFADRRALIDAIELELWGEIRRALLEASKDDPRASLIAQAHAFRAFAREHPAGYALLYRTDAVQSVVAQKARASAVAACLPALAALVGEDDALAAARVLAPFLHGFVSMELAGAFRMGGGLDAAFANGVSTILSGMKKTVRKTRRTRR
ncbi:MAG: TetR/AcrR family transcriptional regulator [Polyangiaceae bacterium]